MTKMAKVGSLDQTLPIEKRMHNKTLQRTRKDRAAELKRYAMKVMKGQTSMCVRNSGQSGGSP
jgi:hypothetical protein